jgi:PAS domain S-box-containing protein
VDDWPDEILFHATIEPALAQAESGLRRKSHPIVAFGEMVALLWAAGKCDAAIRLEQMWNELAHKHSFSLRCAYPMGGQLQEDMFRQVCAEHSAVIPAESYTSLGNEDDRLRMVSSLQQKAQTLQAAVDAREQEIIQRKNVELRLRRTEELANKIVESSVDCVKVLDLEGRLEYMNAPGQKALEIEDMSQILGRGWIDFWSEEDQPRAEAAFLAAKAGGTGSFRGDCSTLGGVAKSWDVKITPVLDGEGQIERLIAVSRDITELKKAQGAVLQAEKLAAIGRMAATIAHEINNPLESVTNFIYLAKTCDGVPKEISGYLDIADQELARVAQIAQRTLGFYRDPAIPRWVSVADLIDDVMAVYESKLRNKHLKAEILADRELMLCTKQGEFKQALANLVANAIDASRGGGTLWLRVQSTRNWANGMDPGVRVTLADNGSGMTPEVQRQVFVPFFTTKADVGTGIGLWVTKSLIEKLGGYLRFRSRHGENGGTVMSFFLPQTDREHAYAPRPLEP